MREILVTDLVKNLLGPRGGARESLDNEHLPLSEYITGVLAPKNDPNSKTIFKAESNDDYNKYLTTEISSSEEDEYDFNDSIESMLNPTISPHKIPSTMGLSFHARSDSILKFDVCITWAIYVPDSNKKPKTWTRNPKYHIFEINENQKPVIYLDSNASECSESTAEISFHYNFDKIDNDSFLVSTFLMNRKKLDRKLSTRSHIFQPQIRILQKDDTEILPMKSSSNNQSNLTDFLYRNKKSFAKGHMTSAIWKDIDPEIFNIPEQSTLKHPHEPGFFWIDSEIIPKDKVDLFSKPTIRTEYIPMYSIPTPDWNTDETLTFDAKSLSEMWNPQILKDALQPIVNKYQKWIEDMENKQFENMDIADQIIKECKTCLSRINSGIDILFQDDDARLAFCFANMAIHLQRQWQQNNSEQSTMSYRPFQIAFILFSIESILNKNSDLRKVCDLLWIPTGAGKTEAYLVLVAIDMAYSRLKSLKNKESGAGVSVFTRYTLRLLTIQQFRRALSIFCAAEFLRVENIGKENTIGWCPQKFQSDRKILWGSTPFSIGLWVGNNVTPNNLDQTRYFNQNHAGALDILKQRSDLVGPGEPAQILNCPACNNILAIPVGEDKIGLEPDKEHSINWIIFSKKDLTTLNSILSEIESVSSIKITNLKFEHLDNCFFTFSITFSSISHINSKHIIALWSQIKTCLEQKNIQIKLQSTSASRPGYFFKKYITDQLKTHEYDFEIFCTNNSCPLKREWFGGSPMGSINYSPISAFNPTKTCNDISLDDTNYLIEIQPCFRKSNFISDRVPIPGLTVDDQIYKTLPTMIISTVDKFARLPFKPSIGGFFGNVEYCHILHGYYRNINDHPKPHGKPTKKYYRKLNKLEIPHPPNFIIQDELHLIEGPLGSMVGIYESCIDFLAKQNNINLKYISSTATIKDGRDQIQSIFSRNFQIFPPHGTTIDDRFFIREQTAHSLCDEEPGRLYVGVLTPGRSAPNTIARIWARLLQSAYENKTNPEIDRFWTLVGYFNTIKELAGTRSLYRQSIPEWMSLLSSDHRQLSDEYLLELSGRTPSDQLPSMLDTLNKKHQDRDEAADVMFTTSMFGTGIDVSRLGLMVMNGQPKTTSAYIQSTGRVGREKGGLVVVFHKATRPRDLSHYEYFLSHHIQLHRNVESSPVHPFSSGAIDRALGPLVVGMLRNMKSTDNNVQWYRDDSVSKMAVYCNNPEVSQIKEFLESRSQQQPSNRRPSSSTITKEIEQSIQKWIDISKHTDVNRYELQYFDSKESKSRVILASLIQMSDPDAQFVFENTPQSLRSLEGETGFES